MAARADAVAWAVFGGLGGAVVGLFGGSGIAEYNKRKGGESDAQGIKNVRKATVVGVLSGAILGAIIGGSGCCGVRVT